MKELKDLLNKQDYISAKQWIIEHREEIDQIAVVLLEEIEDFKSTRTTVDVGESEFIGYYDIQSGEYIESQEFDRFSLERAAGYDLDNIAAIAKLKREGSETDTDLRKRYFTELEINNIGRTEKRSEAPVKMPTNNTPDYVWPDDKEAIEKLYLTISGTTGKHDANGVHSINCTLKITYNE